MSNLLLYGKTANIAAAHRAGLLIGLDSDWSVSGSKGVLGELKAARLAADAGEVEVSDRDLVAMATRAGARMLRWDRAVGSLQPGLRTDLLVIAGTAGDPYKALVEAADSDIRLVAIDGIARYGVLDLVEALSPGAVVEKVAAAESDKRVVYLYDPGADAIVAGRPGRSDHPAGHRPGRPAGARRPPTSAAAPDRRGRRRGALAVGVGRTRAHWRRTAPPPAAADGWPHPPPPGPTSARRRQQPRARSPRSH
ncbi:amidohydrolase family protein [Streptomyces luteogriseus]|uniref:amidohydrolase family protein n=1 Tax=Streptomyces luteogriseus TaxID=68233 RepID=UPI003795BEB0